MRPAGISDSYWNTAFGEFQQQAGPTWGGIVSLLAQYAGVVAASGNTQFDSEGMVFAYAIQGNLQQAEASATGHLYVGDTSHPLAGAEVLLSNATTGNASGGVSNPDGSFIVDALPAGTYDVTVDGYLLPQPLQVTVPASGAATGLAIVASAGGTTAGAVHAATSGAAISGTTVLALNTTDQTTYHATTGADGSYDLHLGADRRDLRFDDRRQSVTKETQYVSNVQITNASTVSNLNFTLAKGATVSGTVRTNGTPVAGASISLTDANGNTVGTTSDANGNYSFTGLSAGSYTEEAISSSSARTQTSLTVTGGATMAAPAVALLPGDTLAITVNKSSGNPLANAAVALTQNGNPVTTLTTNAQGMATFTNLADGAYQLAVSATGLAQQNDSVILANGATLARIYNLAVGNQIKGTVTNGSGQPMPYTLVNLNGADSNGNQIFAQTTTLSDGTYDLTSIPAGTYAITIGSGSGIDGQKSTVTGSASTNTLNFQVAGGGIQGTLTMADGTTPAAGALVDLVQNGQIIAEGQTDNSGHYMFQGLAAGTFHLVAHGGMGFLPIGGGVNVNPTGVTPAPTSSFGNSFLDGIVKGFGPESRSQARRSSSSLPCSPETTIRGAPPPRLSLPGSDGSFNFNQLAPGDYVIVIQGPNFAKSVQTVTITSGPNSQTFPVQPGADVSGTITEASTGAPVSGASVDFVDPTTDQIVAVTTTDSLGDYVETSVAPGIYDIIVMQPNHQILEQVGISIGSIPSTLNESLFSPSTTLNGVVKDANGNLLGGVSVLIYNSAGEQVGDTQTGSDGSYSVSYLPPGSYTVKFESTGIQRRRRRRHALGRADRDPERLVDL